MSHMSGFGLILSGRPIFIAFNPDLWSNIGTIYRKVIWKGVKHCSWVVLHGALDFMDCNFNVLKGENCMKYFRAHVFREQNERAVGIIRYKARF